MSFTAIRSTAALATPESRKNTKERAARFMDSPPPPSITSPRPQQIQRSSNRPGDAVRNNLEQRTELDRLANDGLGRHLALDRPRAENDHMTIERWMVDSLP